MVLTNDRASTVHLASQLPLFLNMSLTCYITFVLTVAVSTVLASNISTLNHGSGCNLLVPEHVRDRMEPVKEPLNIVVILHIHGPLKKILLPAILFFGRIRRDFAEPLPDGAQLSRGPFTVTHLRP